MPTLTQLIAFLEQLAPAQTAEPWDNPGLLVRCGERVTGVLCALDVTPDTVAEALAAECNVIVSHHPVIFRPLKALTERDVPALLVRGGVSAVCLHTNLDKAPGGVNDLLAKTLGLWETWPFAEGLGRVGVLSRALTPAALARLAAERLHTPVRLSDAGGVVCRVAVVSGSGGDLFRAAGEAGAQCLITGEAGHHDALDARAAGVSLIAATHFATEAGIADVLARHIAGAFPGVPVRRSVSDADPFVYLPAPPDDAP